MSVIVFIDFFCKVLWVLLDLFGRTLHRFETEDTEYEEQLHRVGVSDVEAFEKILSEFSRNEEVSESCEEFSFDMHPDMEELVKEFVYGHFATDWFLPALVAELGVEHQGGLAILAVDVVFVVFGVAHLLYVCD